METLSCEPGEDKLYLSPSNVPAGGGGTTASTDIATGSTIATPPSSFDRKIRSAAQNIACGLPAPSSEARVLPVFGSTRHRWPEPLTIQTEARLAIGVAPHAASTASRFTASVFG